MFVIVRANELSRVGAFQNINKDLFDKRISSQDSIYTSGVWRFHEAVLKVDKRYLVSPRR